MKPFFSVLVPVYNVDQYLEQCLKSLLNQTFKNLQIICINDGSTDNSLTILNNYSDKDPRIEILNQNNKGYGYSLNRGMQLVKANYISIVEPDDFIAAETYESFYNDTQEYPQADIIKYAYWNFHNDSAEKKIEPSNSSSFTPPVESFKISQYPQLLLYHPSIWSGIYKTEFLKENNLYFIEASGAAWTDNPFFIGSMCLAHNIIWRNKKYYYYRQGHLTASSTLTDCKVPIMSLLDIFEFIEKNEISDFGILLCVYKRVFHYIDIVCTHKNYFQNEIEPLIQKVLKHVDPNIVHTELFSRQEQQTLQKYTEERKYIE